MSKVLALKYRPTDFSSLIGQESVSQTLSQALNQQRLSHAYLFSGLRGSGKTSTARIFAKSLICENGPTSTPCQVCTHCQMANENRHIDIIEMDGASSRKIDDIRDVIEQTKYKPSAARFKIFIIDEVHMLTKEAFNALLKTLEEPPNYIKFILATTDPLKLPATILSRTQHFRFKHIAQNDVIKHLEYILKQENITYEQEALHIISRAGNGSLRDTLTLLDQVILFSKGNIEASIVAKMIGFLDPHEIDILFDTIFSKDKKRILEVIKIIENYESEMIVNEIIFYVKDKFLKQDPKFSLLICERFFKALNEAKSILHLNPDNVFVLSLLLFKMQEALNIQLIEEAIEKLEKNITNETKKPEQQNHELIRNLEINEIKKEEDKFEKLITNLYERNFDIGECFEKYVKKDFYEENVLCIIIKAPEDKKNTLRHAWGIIKHLIQEIYGAEVKIEVKNEIFEETEIETKKEKETKTIENNQNVETNEEISHNLEDILKQHPTIKLASELFGAETIRVIPKK